MLDTTRSVADLVLDHSECAPVLLRFGIDFCCRGEVSLERACAGRQLDVRVVAADLERAIADRAGPRPSDPRDLSTRDLVGHIVSTHHAYLRGALPTLRTLAAKVARVHGDHNPKLRDVDRFVQGLATALEPHLDREEATLFPALTASPPDREVLAAELAAMRTEHVAVGEMMDGLRAAADRYACPDWACNSYRTLFSELRTFEADVLEHIHLENHVLAPRLLSA